MGCAGKADFALLHIGDEIEGRCPNRLVGPAQDGVEAAIEFAHELAWIHRQREQLLDQTAQDGCDERSSHPVAHHVTDEYGRDRIGNSEDIEEITANGGSRQIAMAKAERALGRGSAARKGRVVQRQEDLLDFARHVEIRLHLGVLLAQRLGIMRQLGGGPLPFQSIAHGAHEEGTGHLAFDQVVLCPLLHRLHGDRLIVQTGHDDDGNVVEPSGDLVKSGQTTTAVRKGEIEQHDVEVLRLQSLQSRSEPVGPLQVELAAAGFVDHDLDEPGIQGAVLDEQRFQAKRARVLHRGADRLGLC